MFENRVDYCDVDCDAVKSRCKIPTFRVACGLHFQGGRLYRNFIDVMTTTEICKHFVTQQHTTTLGRLIVEVCRRRIVKTSSAGTYTTNISALNLMFLFFRLLSLYFLFIRVPLFWLSWLPPFFCTYNAHNTNFHAPSGIRTRNPSKRSAPDPRLRTHHHRNRLVNTKFCVVFLFWNYGVPWYCPSLLCRPHGGSKWWRKFMLGRKYFSTFRTVVCSLLVGIAFWGTGIIIGTAATTSQLRMSVDQHVSGPRRRLLLCGTLAVAYLGCQRACN
jgi:hypothetical protein